MRAQSLTGFKRQLLPIAYLGWGASFVKAITGSFVGSESCVLKSWYAASEETTSNRSDSAGSHFPRLRENLSSSAELLALIANFILLLSGKRHLPLKSFGKIKIVLDLSQAQRGHMHCLIVQMPL